MTERTSVSAVDMPSFSDVRASASSTSAPRAPAPRRSILTYGEDDADSGGDIENGDGPGAVVSDVGPTTVDDAVHLEIPGTPKTPMTPMTPATDFTGVTTGNVNLTPTTWLPTRALLKKRSTKELFEEERYSLPTLESSTSLSGEFQQPLVHRRYRPLSPHSDGTPRRDDPTDVYFSTDSPAVGASANMSKPMRGPVLTEVDIAEDQASKNICILINPKKDRMLLIHEFKREMDELAIQQGDATGRMAEESLESIRNMCFSPALELQLTHNIIQNAFKDYEKEEWVVDINRELTVKDVIKECFPLHDRTFNKKFFAEYRKRTFDLRIQKAASGNSDRWAVEELRLHFGERVAFLFAFMHIYTKHLLPITLMCVCYYLSFRFIDGPVWREYIRGLSLLGFGVVCFWGPSFLVCWERETRILVEKWNLDKYKNTVYEKNDYNPNFQYVWVKNELTKEMEKVAKKRKNHLIQVTMLFYVLISAVIQCLCLVPFIQCKIKNRLRSKEKDDDGGSSGTQPAHPNTPEFQPGKKLTARGLAMFVKQRTGFTVPVLPCTDDCNQYSAYEIVAESKLPVFDPMLDYLDACIQFSYVIMFTVVWPLLPFPAFFNNLLEVRGDAFRLLFANRRPMPRRDTSIGEWVTVLSYANIIGVTVVMAFIVVYHFGYFMSNCNFTFSKGEMVPFTTVDRKNASLPGSCDDFAVKKDWMLSQIFLFVLLEHHDLVGAKKPKILGRDCHIEKLTFEFEVKQSRMRSPLSVSYQNAIASNPDLKSAIEAVGSQPIAEWFTDQHPDAAGRARELFRKKCPLSGASQGADASCPTIVVYGLPNKDCEHGFSTFGSNKDSQAYRAFLQELVTSAQNQRVVYILEPDAIGLLAGNGCGNANNYADNLAMALDVLGANPNADIYLDIGYWTLANDQKAAEVAALVRRVDRAGRCKGIALNTSNYRPVNEMVEACERFSRATSGKYRCIIDTSRNYVTPPSSNEWCNTKGMGIGPLPTQNTGHPLIDYFVWVKPPGESDGECSGRTADALLGPQAGKFFPEHFKQLWNNGVFVKELKKPQIGGAPPANSAYEPGHVAPNGGDQQPTPSPTPMPISPPTQPASQDPYIVIEDRKPQPPENNRGGDVRGVGAAPYLSPVMMPVQATPAPSIDDTAGHIRVSSTPQPVPLATRAPESLRTAPKNEEAVVAKPGQAKACH
ncbi:hypothetical protein P43SY_003133 [Pythium insidiosum]|uniref:Anoctamin transmembrane domain-containing protein n=1 Tax=Pythium insidiosum TaxID=114742 RepID=A0AAD5Q3V5_PYTIN|nr:hypothetical protein P43SY_003133 [Pythium insidiosum]